MLGQLLDGRYKVIEDLAAGGFAQTYLAEDTRLPGNPRCVVKHFNPAISEPDFLRKALELFKIEAETLQKLGKHDQIPQLFAYFEENNEFFLIQEFIEGHPLTKELLPNGQLSEARTIALIQDVLAILKFVHDCDVIHRDIKPNNLLRRHHDGKLVLIDFGTVKQIHTEVLRSNIRRSHITMPIGTPGYMSIEQEQGNSCPNSDIYALGMMALQALTGMHPSEFGKDELGEVKWRLHTSVSQEFGEIIDRMVSYEPAIRYQSVDRVLSDLEKLSPQKPSFRLLPAASPDPATRSMPSPEIEISPKSWWILGGIGAAIVGAISIVNLPKIFPSADPSLTVSVAEMPSPIRDRNNINYDRLRNLLKRKDWKAADAETYELMLTIAGKKSQIDGTFHIDELQEFSCADFLLIDRLWGDESNHTLGFTAQQKIYESRGKDWGEMAKEVGWRSRSGSWLVASQYNKIATRWEYRKGYSPNFQAPPTGHLPVGIREGGRQNLDRNEYWQRCLNKSPIP